MASACLSLFAAGCSAPTDDELGAAPGASTDSAAQILGGYCGKVPSGFGPYIDPCAVSSTDSNLADECSVLAGQADQMGIAPRDYAPVCFGGANANAPAAVYTAVASGAAYDAAQAIKQGAEAVTSTAGKLVGNLFSWKLVIIIVAVAGAWIVFEVK